MSGVERDSNSGQRPLRVRRQPCQVRRPREGRRLRPRQFRGDGELEGEQRRAGAGRGGKNRYIIRAVFKVCIERAGGIVHLAQARNEAIAGDRVLVRLKFRPFEAGRRRARHALRKKTQRRQKHAYP